MDPDDLQARTPDAGKKTHYVVVDAVGVFESCKTYSKPIDRQPSVPLEKILQNVAQGIVHADLTSALASRLARLEREAGYEQLTEVLKVSGVELKVLTRRLLDSIDPDRSIALARSQFALSPDADPTEAQLDEVEESAQREALKPFHNPDLRNLILKIKSDLEQVIDEVTQDELLAAEFGVAANDKAIGVVADFKAFCEKHKDEIEALKVLYSKPYRAGLRYRQVKDLAAKLNQAPFYVDPNDKKNHGLTRLWARHAVAEPEAIKGKGGSQLVDLIALVRHAIHPAEPVRSVKSEVEANYVRWLEEKTASGVAFSEEQRRWLDAIRDHIAASLRIEQDELQDATPFSGMGGLGKVYQLFGDGLPGMLEELNDRLAA